MITRRRMLTAGSVALLLRFAHPQAAQNAKMPTPQPEARVDLNHATVEELLTVPGMTPSWAGRIVRFRPYRSKDELLTRGIVSGAVYNRIKNYVIAHRNAQ